MSISRCSPGFNNFSSPWFLNSASSKSFVPGSRDKNNILLPSFVFQITLGTVPVCTANIRPSRSFRGQVECWLLLQFHLYRCSLIVQIFANRHFTLVQKNPHSWSYYFFPPASVWTGSFADKIKLLPSSTMENQSSS